MEKLLCNHHRSYPYTELTVVFVPTLTHDSVVKPNWGKLSSFIEYLPPGDIKETRVNSRNNIVPVGACTTSAVSTLLLNPMLTAMAVRFRLPRENDTVVAVIQGVHNSVLESDVASIVSSATSVIEVRRFGTSQRRKIGIQGESPIAMVTVTSHRHCHRHLHRARPYVPRPLRCQNCMKLSHVSGACRFQDKRRNCSSGHKATEFTSQ